MRPPAQLAIERGGLDLVGEAEGSGPTVVLLHGLTATRRYVVMGSRALVRSGHRVITFDARGHGDSEPSRDRSAYGYRYLAGDLIATLDTLEIEHAVMVGASMGAHTAVRVAIEHPRRVAGLVVITPAYLPETHDEPQQLRRWDRLADGLAGGGVEGFVAAYGDLGVPPRWRETVLKGMRQRLALHRHPEAVADALRAVPRSRPFDDLDRLAHVGVPAIVVGSRDETDPGHPLAVAEAYARALPGARLVVEEPGRSPLAWQGGQISRLAAEIAGRRGSPQPIPRDRAGENRGEEVRPWTSSP